jgi:CxxC motif-containing protein
MESEIICIICPIGCEVTVHHKEGIITKIEGYECKLGLDYTKEELFDPKRTLTTTMIVKDGKLPLVSVKTAGPVPKKVMFDIMNVISEYEVDAPINIGDILVENVHDLDINIIATKKVKRRA